MTAAEPFGTVARMHKNPYGADLGNTDPLEALADTPRRIRALVEKWPADRWERSYAPGKWTARQIVAHLAQTELALTTRVRFAASQIDYHAQPFSQDDWIALDDHADAATALTAYVALRAFNLAMFTHLTPEQRRRPFVHPEYGELTPDWVAAQLAGHDLHHYKQLVEIK
ncbi:MAG TPA: DinB family protein [Vicinamibacterales bacterium]